MPEIYQPSDQEIALVALDILNGKVYSRESVPEKLQEVVFLPLYKADPPLLERYTPEELSEIAIFAIYGIDYSGDYGISHEDDNGVKSYYPMFQEVHVWQKASFDEALRRAQACLEILQAPTPERKSLPSDMYEQLVSGLRT